jgi:hypothetical protein
MTNDTINQSMEEPKVLDLIQGHLNVDYLCFKEMILMVQNGKRASL